MNNNFGNHSARPLKATASSKARNESSSKKDFNPRGLQKDVAKLQSEGKLPSMQQFLAALAKVKASQ